MNQGSAANIDGLECTGEKDCASVDRVFLPDVRLEGLDAWFSMRVLLPLCVWEDGG